MLLVEDIVDTGSTLAHVARRLRARGVKSLKICALLDKPSQRRSPVKVDYRGFVIPAEFVVGYGLDHNEHFRNLPYVALLKTQRKKQ